jgi:CRP-like cAMP-binding protein
LNFQQKEKNVEKYLGTLSQCSLFLNIDTASLLRMLTCLGARVRHFGKRETIVSEGDAVRDVGVLLSGTAQTVQVEYYGNRNIVSGVTEGELFLEEFACAETDETPVSVVATEECEVMFIDCAHILHTCQNGCGFHHQLIYNLMRGLAEKSISFHERMEITGKRTTREKLIAYLSMMAKRTGKRSFLIPFDRQELADFLEVDRSGLSTEIGKLYREGVITAKKNRFTLL